MRITHETSIAQPFVAADAGNALCCFPLAIAPARLHSSFGNTVSEGLPTIHRTTAEAVAKAVGVAYEPWMQNWPLEAADAARVEEFLTCYGRERNPKHRLAIAALIGASLDEAFALTPLSKELLDRAGRVLKNYPELLDYWSCPDAHTDDEMFHITPWIRTL